nr:hypothetical protein BaRGS_002948 [Batillaria attramentaria]
MGDFCQPKTSKCRALEKFLRQNLDWVTSNVVANSDDDYWYQVRLFYEQFRGLQDGYTGQPGRISMDVDDVFGLYLLQIQAELPDIQRAIWGPSSTGPGFGHCSVLIKVLLGNGGVQDVLTAHDTWTSYSSMLRVLKLYDFYFHKSPTVSEPALGRSWAFSSYPGVLISIDDFYVLSSAMVTTETTNPNFNNASYKTIQPKCVLEGARVTVANRLAEHGDDWSKTFARFNSGTYNNQWMVVDYKQYDEYFHQILPGFLTVLEQIPGKVHYEDQTKILLNTSYWASYNIPYYTDIFEAMGMPEMVSKYGEFFTHDGNPRARIFRRDQSRVKDVDTMTKLMRYNDYKNDPLSRCNCTPPYSGLNGISARGDLNPPDGKYPFKELGFFLGGGTDMKLTSISLTQRGDMLAFRAISGPTFDPLPPFRWSTVYNSSSVSHVGHFILRERESRTDRQTENLHSRFAYLSISTVNDYTYRLNSSVQAYAAGLAEGYITRELISLHYQNTVGSFCQPKTSKCRALEKFLRQNLNWVKENVDANPDIDYWYQVRLFYEQVRGLQDGYSGKPGRISMDVDDIFGVYFLQIQNDAEDIQKLLFGSDFTGPTFGHCSAIVKVLQGNGGVKDVLTAHDTWSSYNTMLRILKPSVGQFVGLFLLPWDYGVH